MQETELTITDPDAADAPAALQDVDPQARFDYDGAGFAVIALEEFFYRINSSLQTVVIFERVGEAELDVVVVAGGGAAGLAKDDFDAEGAATREVVGELESFCEVRDCEVVRG